MNALLFLLGLFGAAAVSGGGSSSTTTSAAATTPTDASDTPPMDDMPTDDMPMDDMPTDDMPMDDAPMGDMPMDDAPMDDMPTDGMPMDDAPANDGGMADMPMDHGDMDHGDMDHGGMDHGDHGGMDDMPGASAEFADITTFGMHHGTSSHTHHDALLGGRTPITTEALEAYNDLRGFLGLEPITDLEDIGEWAFANTLTNNDVPYGDDLQGVGLFYAMQGAKVAWIADDKFDPQILADIQREARLGEPNNVMSMVEEFGLDGFAAYLEDNDMTETFVNTLKMEPHYGGWMHGRTHGWLKFADETGEDVAIAHDLNHLTVLSHDQTQPFMNDTFDWPQWPALDAPEATVANYFQSMVTLGDPQGEGIIDGRAAEEMAWISGLPDGEALMSLLAIESAPEDAPYLEDDAEASETEMFV